jgi:hypothetical protein
MKILHLITDHQVIERTLGIYEEVFPNCNKVLVFPTNNKPFKHLKKYASYPKVNFSNLKQVANDYDFSGITHVIIHYLSLEKLDFIKNVPKKVHVCWEIYGYDLYDQFLNLNGYPLYYKIDPYKYYYHGYYLKHFETLYNTWLFLKGYKYRYKWQRLRQFNYICKRVDCIQYCCGYDAKIVEEYAQRTIPSYEIFNYSLSEVLGDLKDIPFFEGKDILIGNSASFSNNHYYGLDYLKKIGIPDGATLIIPLAYGGIGKYPDDVEQSFNQAFSGRVETYRAYMPLHEYNMTFLRLNAMILSHWRQESQGTAIMGFYLGVKVFMSSRNPLYQWFVDCGFTVFCIEDATKEDLSTPLDIEKRKQNRRIVMERYNEDAFSNTLRLNIK